MCICTYIKLLPDMSIDFKESNWSSLEDQLVAFPTLPPHPTPRREINLQPRYLPPLGTEPAVPLVFGKTFQLTEPQSSRNPKVKGGEPQERLYTSPFRPIV